MSVVGIDFGNDTCYISVARQGGIESIANDYSLRETPSYVAFGEKSRSIGVAAKSGQMTQIKRTFFGFKKLLGRKFDDTQVQAELLRVPFEIAKSETGVATYNINYNGKSKQLSAEQLTAALFTKLKETAETALNVKVNDCVISVPSYFTDAERRALLDSAKMSGLNVLKLMNDTTATALAYGIYKQDLPEPDKPSRNVVFVDCGHTGTQVAAASFNKGKLSMLASGFCNSGGRNFDEEMCKHFAAEFSTKYKLNVFENKKATMKLLTECVKLKKLMAANTNKLPINIECFMDDKDVSGHMDRAKFEELIAHHLAEMEKTMSEVLAASGLKQEDIYSVEIVGGSTRIPAIKALMEKVFVKEASTTLNADEAVSRGCALQCAILSPVFKVREFSVTDIQPYPIKLVWDNTSGEGQATGDMEVFPVNHPVPFSKMLTFYKTETFQVTGEYASDVPYPEKHIGVFEIGDIKPNAEGGSQKVKVKVRVNPNGIFGVASANLVEKHEIEEEVPEEMEVDEKKDEGDKKEEEKKEEKPAEGAEAKTEEKMDTAEPKPEDKKEVKMVKRKKVVNKNVDLPISQRVNGQLSYERLQAATQEENSMNNQDRNEADRLTAKNSVEEYIYDIRGKLCEELEEFMIEEDRNKYSLELEDAENWLYEDGEFSEKPEYQKKLNELQVKGEAAKRRRYEYETRPEAINQFGQCLQLAQKVVDAYKGGDEKYNHLEAAEVDKVQKAINEKQDWFSRMCADIQKLQKTSDPPVLASQFMQEKDQFWQMGSKILNKPKPKVEPPLPEGVTPAGGGEAKTEKKDESSDKDQASESKPAEKVPEMDVD